MQIFDLPRLRFLSVASNDIDKVCVNTFSKLPQLQILDLSKNKLEHILLNAVTGENDRLPTEIKLEGTFVYCKYSCLFFSNVFFILRKQYSNYLHEFDFE